MGFEKIKIVDAEKAELELAYKDKDGTKIDDIIRGFKVLRVDDLVKELKSERTQFKIDLAATDEVDYYYYFKGYKAALEEIIKALEGKNEKGH